MNYSFEGRHVVVTGGTGALGTAVVRSLADSGAICHIPAFDKDEIAHFPLSDHGSVHLAEDVDLTDEHAVRAYYGSLPALWASVHCAGGFDMSPITDTGLAALERLLSINVVTSYLCTKEAVRTIRERGEGGGRIVNVSAQPGIEPRNAGGLSAYAAAKAAVAALSLSVASEVAAEDIWVNAIAPSIMDTPANRRDMPDADHAAWPSVEEVAATIVFLASPENRVTRAGVIPVYGRS